SCPQSTACGLRSVVPIVLLDLAAFAAVHHLGEVFVDLVQPFLHIVAAELHLRRAPALQHGPILIRQAGVIRDAVDDDCEGFRDFVVRKSNLHYCFTRSYQHLLLTRRKNFALRWLLMALLRSSVSLARAGAPSARSVLQRRIASFPSFESSALSTATALTSIISDQASGSSSKRIIDHSPVKVGALFSKNARTPSARSFVVCNSKVKSVSKRMAWGRG